MDTDTGTPRIRPLRYRLAYMVIGVAIVVGFGFGTTAIFQAAGAKEAWLPFYGSVFGVLAITLLIQRPVNSALRRRARERGQKETALYLVFFQPGHHWLALSAESAAAQWAQMRAYPEGGRVLSGWRCRDCTQVRLECRDQDGVPYTVLTTGAVQGLWVIWLLGAFLRRSGRYRWAEKLVAPSCIRATSVPVGSAVGRTGRGLRCKGA